jgi:uncharacterized protein
MGQMGRKIIMQTDIPQILCPILPFNKEAQGQCDCACVLNRPLNLQSSNAVTHNLYLLSYPFFSVPLTDDGYYATLGSHSGMLVINRSALEMINHFSQAHPLEDIPPVWQNDWGKTVVQSSLEQMVELRVLVPESYSTLVCHESSTVLAAWLHITDRCNLRCSYCYLPHQHADMSVEIGRMAIEATFRSALAHDYQEVKFKYAGGEPLLRFKTITELHRYAQILADQYGLALDGVVLSNGTLLTPGMVEQMQSLGLRLMISLDGLEQFHDRQRFYPERRGSFDTVSKAIELAVSHGLIPEISITVSGRNVAGLPELVGWMLEQELPFSLNFYREHDLSSSEFDLELEEEKIIEGMLAAYKILESNLPRRSLLTALVDRANFAAPHLRTCGVGQSYLVFDPHGRVAKCQMDIGKAITNVYNPDPLAFIRKNNEGIQNVTVEEKAECRDCQWRYWCAGGCPLLTYRATGRYDLKSPNCNIYKALFPEVIRLEGLRLLRSLQ